MKKGQEMKIYNFYLDKREISLKGTNFSIEGIFSFI